jgi:small subunit ribosomal protein S2
LPGALFIVDTKKEYIALREASKLGIPVIAIVDTNVNPQLVDYPIPANDDASHSIALITKALTDAVLEGRQHHSEKQAADNEEKRLREAKLEKEKGEE